MKWIVSLCGVGAFLSVVGVASAVPAPLSPEELETGAELIVDAEVTKVSCLGQQTVPGVGTTTTYRSTFEILNLYKGTDPDPLQISFEISDGDPGLCAWAEPPHPVGQRAKLWLNAMGDGSYGMISWNAMEELSDSDPQPLDACGLPGFDDAESGDDEDSGEVADAGTEPEDAGPVVDDISEETDTGSELSDARGTDDAESGAPDAGMSAADAMPESSDADGEAGAQSDAQSAAGRLK